LSLPEEECRLALLQRTAAEFEAAGPSLVACVNGLSASFK
jgi:hypothetical protein